MLVPIFSLSLNQKVLPRQVTIGKYDGFHPCLTAATTADKVFIHNPYQRAGIAGGRISQSSTNVDISLLNINQSITAVSAGHLTPDFDRDLVVVGTATNLLAYDVENNADIFYKEVPEGASVITIGHLGGYKNPLVIAGGNCALQGFDHEGNDPFWTVTGDNVCSLALIDFDLDGENELIVGSEDYDIRIFKEDEIIAEITETEAVTALTPVKGNKFGYALANGTVGVYEKVARWWRIKSKNQAVAIYSFDLDGDGVRELITGWSNGKVDARNDRTGEVIFKENFNHSVAGIVEGDYRLSGKNDLICCSVEGEVRGYGPPRAEGKRPLLEVNVEQETLHELSQKKQNLLLELRNYEENSRYSGIGEEASALSSLLGEEVGIIPAQTQLQTGLAVNMGNNHKPPHVEVALSTNNDTVVRAVLIFAEGIFDGESHVVHPKESQLSSNVHVPIYPPKDIPVDLHIKAMVGYKGSQHFHVFELMRQLPRFSMYATCAEPTTTPTGFVTFHINERVQRIVMWINQNFLLMSDLEVKDNLNVTFLSLRSNKEIIITMESNGHMTFKTDCMDLAGELIQSLATFLNIEDLQVSADFPQEQEKLAELLERVSGLQEVRQRLGAEMADQSGLIRSLVVRAEDSRLMWDMKNMRKWYSQLYEINKDLIQGYKIRCNNHQELLESLKEVNQTIQKSANLRVGKSKTNIISACRNAIKNNNVNSLIKIIKTGQP